MVDDADSLVRVDEALRLPQSDRRSGYGLRDYIFIKADSFCPIQRLTDQPCAVVPSVFDVNVRWVFFAQRLAVPAVNLPGKSSIVKAAEQLVREGLAPGVRLLVDVKLLQPFEIISMLCFEHGGTRYAYGRDSHVPEALGVAFSLDQYAVTGLLEFREPPYAVGEDLPFGAIAPAEIFLSVAFPVQDYLPICPKIRDSKVWDSVFVFLRGKAAGVPQKFQGELFVRTVLLQSVW